jgi:hypothetical protein
MYSIIKLSSSINIIHQYIIIYIYIRLLCLVGPFCLLCLVGPFGLLFLVGPFCLLFLVSPFCPSVFGPFCSFLVFCVMILSKRTHQKQKAKRTHQEQKVKRTYQKQKGKTNPPKTEGKTCLVGPFGLLFLVGPFCLLFLVSPFCPSVFGPFCSFLVFCVMILSCFSSLFRKPKGTSEWSIQRHRKHLAQIKKRSKTKS